jgi:8-oxo-dGTP pyrophosphatase MutT (NUDIX family)
VSSKISVTVAAIVQREGRFLLVEEETDEGVRINQPAGHLEPGEPLASGAVRETLEETAWHFTPGWLLGVYRWQHPRSGITYVRFAFGGEVSRHEPDRRLDEGILRALWLTPAELRAQSQRHRSPLVLRCVEDCLAGRRFPLDLIADLEGCG